MTIDPNYGHHESCACLRPGDAMCNCGQIYDTPPAHGDGEGEPVAFVEMVNDEWQFSTLQSAPKDTLTTMRHGAHLFLTTRPTPEAQEARDGRPTMRELIDVLPGVYYMDPPDGGSVSLLEQLQRMAQDAARYRWLKSGGYEHADDGQPYAVVNRQDDYGNWCETIIEDDEADALIDAALALPAQGEGKNA